MRGSSRTQRLGVNLGAGNQLRLEFGDARRAATALLARALQRMLEVFIGARHGSRLAGARREPLRQRAHLGLEFGNPRGAPGTLLAHPFQGALQFFIGAGHDGRFVRARSEPRGQCAHFGLELRHPLLAVLQLARQFQSVRGAARQIIGEVGLVLIAAHDLDVQGAQDGIEDSAPAFQGLQRFQLHGTLRLQLREVLLRALQRAGMRGDHGRVLRRIRGQRAGHFGFASLDRKQQLRLALLRRLAQLGLAPLRRLAQCGFTFGGRPDAVLTLLERGSQAIDFSGRRYKFGAAVGEFFGQGCRPRSSRLTGDAGLRQLRFDDRQPFTFGGEAGFKLGEIARQRLEL